MALFDIPKRPDKSNDNAIAKKTKQVSVKSNITSRGTDNMLDRINTIRAVVEKNLGYLSDKYIIIRTEEELQSYIDTVIHNGIISIDTETTGLDPLSDEIVGISIYTPNERAAYLPINHKSYITTAKVDNQISIESVTRQFSRLSNVKILMFNACFDIRFILNSTGIKLKCYWDCYLAARLLNENEGRGNNGLKKLHNKYVLDGQGDAFRFDDLFSGITFDLVPITTGYIYAAHDAEITYELFKFQEPYLTADNELCIAQGLQKVAWVFHNIEMPCVSVVVDMENVGVDFDIAYSEKLQVEYHKLLEDKIANVYVIQLMLLFS